MTHVVDAIERDHREMEDLFAKVRYQRDQRGELVQEIKARLIAHSRAEEEIVYPVLQRDPEEAGEVYHGIEEHREAEDLLLLLENRDLPSEEFDMALDDFVAAVRHHVEEEEEEILPSLAESVDEETLQSLGQAFEERRREILDEMQA